MSRQTAIDLAALNAPYLSESLALFPDIAHRFLNTDPKIIFTDLVDNLPKHIRGLDDEMKTLRVLKRQAHLVIALSDISEQWDWSIVTEHLSQLADTCIKRILRAAAVAQSVDGTPENPVPGLFVLAVGKYGARELNYSSDIDFNVFYDPERVVLPNPARAERTLIRLVQGLVRGMEAITEDGYIFRTDLRLRPDPRSNAIAVSTKTAERYYETIGQNWERAAMIKARCCAGDVTTGRQFMEEVLSPFIWRRNLDYAAIEDILAMKRQIHSRNGGEKISIPGHHLKLGIGGIREIEFYAQVQQLILGGRKPELRSPRTVDALAQLAQGKFIEKTDAQNLIAHYSVLRKLEHRAQMVDDAQTHDVPIDQAKREQFARLSGYPSLERFDAELKHILTDVRRIYSELFPDASSLSSSQGNLVFTGVEPGPSTLKALKQLGYLAPTEIWEQMAAWLGGRIKATRSERARELLTVLAPKIIEYCAETGKPDQAFTVYGRFFTGLNSGVSLLSRFNQRPEQLKYLISLMVKSSHVAETIVERPAILDALSDPEFLQISEVKLNSGAALIRTSEDLEAAMNAARRWVREEHFRLSAAILSGLLNPLQAGGLYSILAEVVIAELLPFAVQDVERRSGSIKGDIAIIGLGKLGSREMSLTSDLDLMLIYDQSDDEAAPLQSFIKVTQRLISALSAVTEEGGLYEVDMALRPSGRAGPVAVSIEAFERYYAQKAWSWEFMALCRSRVICASSAEFLRKLEAVRQRALLSKRPDLNFDVDIADMLKRVRREKPSKGNLDIKNRVGGIRDIEFIAQKSFLLNRSKLVGQNLITTEDFLEHAEQDIGLKTKSQLIEAYRLFHSLSQILAVCYGNKVYTLSSIDQEIVTQILNSDGSVDLISDLDSHCANISNTADNFVLKI